LNPAFDFRKVAFHPTHPEDETNQFVRVTLSKDSRWRELSQAPTRGCQQLFCGSLSRTRFGAQSLLRGESIRVAHRDSFPRGIVGTRRDNSRGTWQQRRINLRDASENHSDVEAITSNPRSHTALPEYSDAFEGSQVQVPSSIFRSTTRPLLDWDSPPSNLKGKRNH
jgi:hypothetical protein